MSFASGDVVILSCPLKSFLAEFILDVRGKEGHVTFASSSRPYDLLTVSEQTLALRFTSNASPRSCLFQIEFLEKQGIACRLKCFALNKREPSIYLGFKDSRKTWCAGELDYLDCAVFSLELKQKENAPLDHKLLSWQKERFVLEGYLHMPSLIPQELVETCLLLINKELGTVGRLVHGGVQEGRGKLDGLNAHPVLCSLITKTVKNVVESFLGPGNLNSDKVSAQLALRFPQEVTEMSRRRWHTDGLRQGRRHGFSLLVGVALSDVLDDDCGNLLLWPGTHVPVHHATVDDSGRVDSSRLLHFLGTYRPAHHEMDPGIGSPDSSSSFHQNDPDLPELGEPFSLRARKGDVIVIHPDLAHCGGITTRATYVTCSTSGYVAVDSQEMLRTSREIGPRLVMHMSRTCMLIFQVFAKPPWLWTITFAANGTCEEFLSALRRNPSLQSSQTSDATRLFCKLMELTDAATCPQP